MTNSWLSRNISLVHFLFKITDTWPVFMTSLQNAYFQGYASPLWLVFLHMRCSKVLYSLDISYLYVNVIGVQRDISFSRQQYEYLIFNMYRPTHFRNDKVSQKPCYILVGIHRDVLIICSSIQTCTSNNLQQLFWVRLDFKMTSSIFILFASYEKVTIQCFSETSLQFQALLYIRLILKI